VLISEHFKVFIGVAIMVKPVFFTTKITMSSYSILIIEKDWQDAKTG
jgi:hypothetical protein